MNNTVRVKKPGKNLFLLEIIIVILFFSLSAAIIVQLFADAYVKSRDGRCLVKAVTAASNYAEVYKAEHGDMNRTISLLNHTQTQDKVIIHYDRDFNALTTAKPEGKAVYTLTAQQHVGENFGYYELDPNGTAGEVAGLIYCTVTVKKGSDVIFEIQVAA